MAEQLNIIGRTAAEQVAVDEDVESRGSLWPRFEFLYRFIFSHDGLERVFEAKQVLKAHRQKCAECLQ